MRLARTLLLAALGLTANGASAQREPIVGLPCEGCESVFVGMPAQLPARTRLAPAGEAGTPMVVSGLAIDPQGRPRAGIIVYAYQTDSKGIYPKSPLGVRHGALRAWVKTDAAGRYTFETIRPASYPSTDIPQHIHLHVIEPGCSTYYIDDILFSDDPKLTAQHTRRLTNRGGNGVVTPAKKDGTQHVIRDIHLGQHIPGYSPCKSQPQ